MPTQDSKEWNAYTGLYAVIHLHETPATEDNAGQVTYHLRIVSLGGLGGPLEDITKL